jgi:formate-dependent phosphoribosylglycinamide formyltransferase (GAR transformylase)
MTSTVLMISPGYPAEMPFFTRGLARAGARVIGAGDQSVSALPDMARDHLAAYWQVPSFADEDAILREVVQRGAGVHIDHVASLWEPTMVLAARIRETLGIPGMTVEQTIPFRDKERMKQVLDAAGIRTPHHYKASTASGVREAVERIGYPIIVKPIAGAGSADTYRVDTPAELEDVLPRLVWVDEVSVEEFVEASEYTYDTICSGGEVLFDNVASYRPRPLITRQLEWISPVTLVLRDIDAPELSSGRAMGRDVLRALGFRDGFTHMEWYRRENGEVVFGEIGARPPGARTVDVMNFANDIDLFQQWAEALVHGRLSEPIDRRYNAASIFKRAQGRGRITHIEGLSRLLSDYDEWVCAIDLLPIGAPRRNWLMTLISDGMVIVRHPDLDSCIEIADRFATELQLYAD